jgi:hypothetical protein
MPIERTDHLTELQYETVDADGVRCSECGGVAKHNKLLIYATVRGTKRRTHNGSFCSKLCHDIFHGLKPRS